MMLTPPQAEIVFQHVRDEEPPRDLVTVAVSLYNYAQFLPECLEFGSGATTCRHRACRG